MTKSILFLLRASPAESVCLVEALDAALVAGVFDQKVSILFKDAGVTALSSSPSASVRDAERLGENLSSLKEYGINDIYVCLESLVRHNLQPTDLAIAAQPIDVPRQQLLIANSDAVVND